MNKDKYKIIYQDSSILIVDKAQGLATALGKKECLCDIIFHDFPELKFVKGFKENEGGLLNRLDNETGGFVLFAKNNDAFLYYSEQMKKEKIEKVYYAWVEGNLQNKTGEISCPIIHHRKNKKKMEVVKNNQSGSNPQKAVTKYREIKKEGNNTLLEVHITKGKRHQIRVHLGSIGHPIIGDKLYNKKKYQGITNHKLYAVGISFVPFGGKKCISLKIDPGF